MKGGEEIIASTLDCGYMNIYAVYEDVLQDLDEVNSLGVVEGQQKCWSKLMIGSLGRFVVDQIFNCNRIIIDYTHKILIGLSELSSQTGSLECFLFSYIQEHLDTSNSSVLEQDITLYYIFYSDYTCTLHVSFHLKHQTLYMNTTVLRRSKTIWVNLKKNQISTFILMLSGYQLQAV